MDAYMSIFEIPTLDPFCNAAPHIKTVLATNNMFSLSKVIIYIFEAIKKKIEFML